MVEELKIKGQWWLPEKPDVKLSGTLTFSPFEGLHLEVQGSFKEVNLPGKLSEPDIILGLSHEGQNITLYKCLEISHKRHFSEVSETIFTANVGFIGAHFTNLSEIKFKKISV